MLHFSLTQKISITIVVVGLFGIMLVYYISNSYKDFAYQHHTQSIQQLAYLEVDDRIEELKANSLDLALTIEQGKGFKRDFKRNNLDGLTQELNNQFYQYFVTAGVIKLLKLYILDTDFTLLGTSSDGIETNPDSPLICPQLSQSALNRHGAEKLQTMSRICMHDNYPVFAVIVPFGGLNPVGYIQVITDLSHSLKKIEASLAMPIQVKLLDEHIIYQSEQWLVSQKNINYLEVKLPIADDRNSPVLNIILNSDMTNFNRDVLLHRNWIMALALVTTALTAFIVLLVLQKSTIPPLAKIHDVLERIHSHHYTSDKNNRLLFQQLLENIIILRKNSRLSFSVMMLDLNHFKKINSEFGKTIGDLLLIEVENRLSSILRDTDLISWVGTDTPGHKLLPSDNKTQYRATIARLGGDEFGLLLPSAQTADQATAVAQRIIETLNKPFVIYDQNIKIDCKIGISIFPDHGEDEKILVRNADKAMQHAKSEQLTIFIYNTNLSSV